MKATILLIEEVFDSINQEVKYQAVLSFDKVPDLKLGGCEVKQ